MAKIKQAIFAVAAGAAVTLLPMAPAMAGGHGFRPLHAFGIGHGLLGAAVALATLPLVVASNVVAGIGESGAQYPTAGYAGPTYGYAPPVAYVAPRPYYAPYAGYRGARVTYGPRGYYAPHPGNYGRGYYRSGGNSYPRR
jgi:hypothetical protein